MKNVMKHTETLMKRCLVPILTLIVMLAMLVTSANASHGPQVSKKENNSAWLTIESQDCLLAGGGARKPGSSGMGKPRQAPPPKDKPTRLKATWLPAEALDCLIAGRGASKPGTASPGKPRKVSRPKNTPRR